MVRHYTSIYMSIALKQTTFITKSLFIQQIFTESYYAPKLIYMPRLEFKAEHNKNKVTMSN